MADWLSSWLAGQEDRGSIPGYLLLPNRDMAEIPLKRLKSSIQQTNQLHVPCISIISSIFVTGDCELLNTVVIAVCVRLIND